MNLTDLQRSALGLSGSVIGFTLVDASILAALLASLATAVFMTFSALEKWEARRARLAAGRPPDPR